MLKKIAALACLATIAAGAAALAPVQMGPGATKEHARLMEDLGTWKAEGKMYMPGMPATAFSGMEINTKLGEFWIVSKFHSEIMGMPFEGLATAGYDPQKKKFVGTWIDAMNPTMSVMEGAINDKGELVYRYEQHNAMTDTMEKIKSVHSVQKDGKRSFTSYIIGEDGTETLGMEIHYTKATGAIEAGYEHGGERAGEHGGERAGEHGERAGEHSEHGHDH